MATNARLRTQAIARGVKEVVFDPMCNFAGGKATEWIPILPGTDSAVALAMCNHILNVLNVYDARYLKAKTNLSYLIGTDGHYVRDKETEKPLVFDARENKAKVFDDLSIGPDLSYLETDAWQSEIDSYFFSQSPSYEDWYCHMQKQVAKPIGESRYFLDVYIERLDRRCIAYK